MKLAELTLWTENSSDPALIISRGRLLQCNAAASALLGTDPSGGPFTLHRFAEAMPELAAGLAGYSAEWPVSHPLHDQYFQARRTAFVDSTAVGMGFTLIELHALAWQGAPTGFNAGWLQSVAPDAQAYLLVNRSQQRISAAAAALNHFGLSVDGSVEDFWSLIRPTDQTRLQACLDQMENERWRVSESLTVQIRLSPEQGWDAWQVQLRRPPAPSDQGWIALALQQVESTQRSGLAPNAPVSGKVGAGSMVVVQITGFRDFVETHGGDLARALTAQFIAQVQVALSERDRAWKLSDDTVAVWFPGDTRGRRSDDFWNGLIDRLGRPLVFRDQQHRARLRAGRARAVNPESRAEHLVERAVACLADANIGQINQASASSDRANEASKTVRRRQSQLLQDFDEGRYRMIYQPISYPSDPNDPVGVEALSRSVSSTGELFSGGDIVLAAQRHDFVREWTEWGLHQVQSDLSDWLQDRPDRFVTFNVMPSLLREQASVEWLIERLRDLPEWFRARLNLEITEQAIGNLMARDSLNALRDLGVALYLDDFGAGDSNLYRLIDIRPEAIKLDRFLIELILDDQPKIEVLTQVLNLARTISPCIIAEGIETETQYNLVKSLDVDLVQGYYLGRRLDLESGKPLGSALPSSL